MPAGQPPSVPEPGDSISKLLLEENRDTFAAARQAIVERVLRATVQEAINALGGPEDIASKALDLVGTDHEVLRKAQATLTGRLLQGVARRTTEALADAGQTAQQAQAHVGDEHEALTQATGALKGRLLAEVARRATEALADAGKTAQQARAHLGEHTLVVQAVDVLREVLVEEIARRATEALADADEAAQQAQARIGAEHETILAAVDQLKARILQTIVSGSLARIQDEVGGAELLSLLDATPPAPDPETAAADRLPPNVQRIEKLVIPDDAEPAGDGYPGAEEPDEDAPEAEAADAEGRPTVLLLEDHPDTRKLLMRLLAPHYAVVESATADEAVAAARKKADGGEVFDVLLLDIHLGGGPNGCDVLGQLRALPGFAEAPAAACTAYVSPTDFERLFAAGFTSVVAKPIKKNVLLDALQRLIRQKNAA